QGNGGLSYGQFDPYAGGEEDDRYNRDVEATGGMASYEMQPTNQTDQTEEDPHTILNQCRDVDRGIDSVDQYVDQIGSIHKRLLSDADFAREGELRAQAEDLADQTKQLYRSLVERMKSIKRSPQAGSAMNSAQIGKVERRLKAAIESYQKMQVDFRKGFEDQAARQYRIVRPEATEAEVQEAVQDTANQQIFSQALIQSDRRGDAQKVSDLVRQRHADIQKIERDFEELAQMFADLDALVIQQEPAVQQIDEQGQTVVENIGEANQQIDSAIEKAKARNRKKWWCVLIAILIIIVIVVVIVVPVEVTAKH
ncbi:Plasma membrane t-SNARE, secretory vesicle fusion, partial [Ascosphaera atra]